MKRAFREQARKTGISRQDDPTDSAFKDILDHLSKLTFLLGKRATPDNRITGPLGPLPPAQGEARSRGCRARIAVVEAGKTRLA